MMKFRRKTFGGLALAVASITVLAACSSSSSSSPSAAASAARRSRAAPRPGRSRQRPHLTTSSRSPAAPTISVTNISQFQFLMYRPLYWFGDGVSPTLNHSLSLADSPTFSGKNVTITLKPYMWSNGTPVTATDVMFWLNMEQAVGATDYGGFTGFPNTVVNNLKVVSPTELTFTLDKPVLAVLVAVQRAEPGHPDAGGLGPHRVRAQQLRHHGQRLRCRLQVPGRPVQEPERLCVLAAVVRRGRAVEAERVQRRRARHVRAEHVLLRAGQAEAVGVPGVAVHHRLGRV